MTTLRLPRLSRRALLLAVAAVLAAAILIGGGWWWSGVHARRVEATYATVLTRVEQSLGPQAPAEIRAAALKDLEATLARYPSARMAAQAAYELGNVRFGERDWTRARAAYEIAAARAEAPTLRTLARLGVGYAWEGERNYPKALEAYQAALASLKPGDFGYEELLVATARTQERAGKRADAIETYRRLLKDAPQSLRAPDIRSHLATLGVAP